MSIRLQDFKRGDTFVLDIELENGEGSPISSPALERIRAHIRDKAHKLIISLQVELGETEGSYRFVHEDTSAWPTTQLMMDIELTMEGRGILSSPTMMFSVVKDVTYSD